MNFLNLIRMGPYRLFFPLGVLCGLLGVGHWTLWSIGWIEQPSPYYHASVQSQGFLGCIAVGFLLTFLPRAMGTREATAGEVFFCFLCGLFNLIFNLLSFWTLGQIAFLFMLLGVVMFGARRIRSKTKDQAGSLILFDFGILHAVLGTVLILISLLADLNPYFLLIGRQMVQLGFLLCLVLAMTGFLTPFLLGSPQDPNKPKYPMKIHAVFGFLLLISFFIEPEWSRLSLGLRAFLVTIHLFLFAGIHRRTKKKQAYIYMYRLATWMFPIGLWFGFIAPTYRVAATHVVFIGGFSLLIFSFGTLVVFSHSGKAFLLNRPLPVLWGVGLFTLVALGFRLASDFYPNHYFSFIHTASGLWILAAAVWLIYIFPKLWSNPIPKKPETSK